MVNCKVDSNNDKIEKLASMYNVDADIMSNMIFLARDELVYFANTGIKLDKVDIDNNFNPIYYISIPKTSYFKNSDNEAMIGEVLLRDFKNRLSTTSNINIDDIQINYFVSDYDWTENDTNDAMNRIVEEISKNEIYPYNLEE